MTLDLANSVPLCSLDKIDVSSNRLSLIDVAAVPNLKTLNIDGNSITRVENLNYSKHLDTISWREQTLNPASGSEDIQYNDCYEVRNLCLSGSSLPIFSPSTPFLNLHYLEMASTGMQSLSPDFGLQCPNIRILNVNYNALRDLRPLLGIEKLERLFLAGNRVSRLRRTAAVLDRISKALVQVDLRNNPLTVGFYTPQEPSQDEKRVVPHGRSRRGEADHIESEAHNTNSFLLPALDKESDNVSRERLDEDTKLRRRVYEMLVVNGCKHLERLDGLEVDREAVGRRDGVWKRLLELGVLKNKSFQGDEEEVK